MRRRLFALVPAAVLGAQLPSLPTLKPVDEARDEPALAAVRDKVLEAAKAKDAAGVMAFVSASLLLGDVREPNDTAWHHLDQFLTSPDDDVWETLRDSLSFGGAFVTMRGSVEGRREFCAPYVYAAFPPRHELPESVLGEALPWVITAKNVEVHVAPDASSRVLGRLSYAMVQAPGATHHDPETYNIVWKTIDLPDAGHPDPIQAFVRADVIRNPEGPHVCFAYEAGQWAISAIAERGQISSGVPRMPDTMPR